MIERRIVTRSTQLRATSGLAIDGHAAVFDQDYVLWDEGNACAVETVKPGAFSRAIKEKHDVRALLNHDPNQLLGRTSAGTLELKEDSVGLYFKVDPPDTQLGRDVHTLVKRGDLSGCSFAFRVTKQNVTETKKSGKLIRRREIEDVDLYDVGPVTYPAYAGTDVNARALELRSVMFPDGVPSSLLRLVPSFRASSASADGDDRQSILAYMDMRLRRAGLTPVR